jgi:hypothetical protein
MTLMERTMFDVRPDVKSPGFRIRPPDEEEVPGLHNFTPPEEVVPGFRMNADGSVRTSHSSAGRPASFTPVRWTSNPTARSASILPFWDDVRDAAKGLGEQANAVVNGAYRSFPGPATFSARPDAG